MKVKYMINHILRNALIGIIAVLTGCKESSADKEKAAAILKKEISEIQGIYAWSEEQNAYTFSEKSKLDEIVSTPNQKSTIEALINCIDDTRPSASTLDNKQVPIGVICYEGLSLLVYYEPTNREGDIDIAWPGTVHPNASSDELRSAKSAWLDAQERKFSIYQ